MGSLGGRHGNGQEGISLTYDAGYGNVRGTTWEERFSSPTLLAKLG